MKSKTVINDVMNANVSQTCQQQTNNEKDPPNVRQYKERIAELKMRFEFYNNIAMKMRKERLMIKTKKWRPESIALQFKATNIIVRIQRRVRIFIDPTHGISVKHS